MKNKITALFLIAATWVIILPVHSAAYSVEEKTNPVNAGFENYSANQTRRGKNRRWNNRRSNRRVRTYRGYRNYGQYRRTRVGNRRYRVVPRYYWRNGRRQVRYVRVYY